MRKKPGHCFEDPGYDPRSKVCGACLGYVRTKCSERKARKAGEPVRGTGCSEADKAMAAVVELNERFLDRMAGTLRRMARMGKDVKQVVFRGADGKAVVFAAYSRTTGRMKVSTARWPKGRMFDLKCSEDVEALFGEVAAST